MTAPKKAPARKPAAKKAAKKAPARKSAAAAAQPEAGPVQQTPGAGPAQQPEDPTAGMTAEQTGAHYERLWKRERYEQLRMKNEQAAGQLVKRDESIRQTIAVLNAAWQRMQLIPDNVGPNLYQQSKKKIRERLLAAVDKCGEEIVRALEDMANAGNEKKEAK